MLHYLRSSAATFHQYPDVGRLCNRDELCAPGKNHECYRINKLTKEDVVYVAASPLKLLQTTYEIDIDGNCYPKSASEYCDENQPCINYKGKNICKIDQRTGQGRCINNEEGPEESDFPTIDVGRPCGYDSWPHSPCAEGSVCRIHTEYQIPVAIIPVERDLTDDLYTPIHLFTEFLDFIDNPHNYSTNLRKIGKMKFYCMRGNITNSCDERTPCGNQERVCLKDWSCGECPTPLTIYQKYCYTSTTTTTTSTMTSTMTSTRTGTRTTKSTSKARSETTQSSSASTKTEDHTTPARASDSARNALVSFGVLGLISAIL